MRNGGQVQATIKSCVCALGTFITMYMHFPKTDGVKIPSIPCADQEEFSFGQCINSLYGRYISVSNLHLLISLLWADFTLGEARRIAR